MKFNVGTRVNVYAFNGKTVTNATVTDPGSSESCEPYGDPNCQLCKGNHHVPLQADGDDFSMGIAIDFVRPLGSYYPGDRVTIDSEYPGTVMDGPEDCAECSSGVHIPVRLDMDRGHSVIEAYDPSRVARTGLSV